MRSAAATVLCLAAQATGTLAGLVRSPPPPPPHEPDTFTNRTILEPHNGARALYARIAELSDGTLLVTSTVGGGGWPRGAKTEFPVFESKDSGNSWTLISNITDQVNGWGMSAQPALLELRQPLGKFAPGTILAAGNSWSGTGTHIDLYASTDKARSWTFVSHVAEGGPPNTTNGATPVWEPFLLAYDNELIVYYSDQRDPKHGQKLSHQTSRDLLTWGPVVNDVRYEEYLARPGMTTTAFIPPLNKWIVTYELPVGTSSSHGANYPVNYKLASDPRKFDSAQPHTVLVTLNNGTQFAPNASPYVVWSSAGGPLGTIVVSDADHSQVFTNTRGGDPNAWEMHESGQGAAYSRALHVFEKKQDRLIVLGGDTFNGNGWGGLSLSVDDVQTVLAAPQGAV